MNARGVALVLVMWLLVLLVAMAGTFVGIARSEYRQGVYARDSAQARYVAETAIDLAVHRMLDPEPSLRFVPDGRIYRFAIDGSKVALRVLDDTARIDLNVADATTLARLFVAEGLPEVDAQALADAILDWRDSDDLVQLHGAEDKEYADAGLPYGAKDSPFESVDELQQVLGMTPELYARVRPYLTVYTASAPRPDFASAPVLTALALDPSEVQRFLAERARWWPGLDRQAPILPGGGFINPEGSGMYSISALVETAGGSRLRITRTLRIDTTAPDGRAYWLLATSQGDFE